MAAGPLQPDTAISANHGAANLVAKLRESNKAKAPKTLRRNKSHVNI
jgi:hypothetical protein